jgi:hypothetical protein
MDTYSKYDRHIYTIKELENEILIDTLENNLSYYDWNIISINQKLSYEFMEKYSDKLHLKFLCIHQKLSCEFIEKHFDKLSIDNICQYQILSEEFIEKYKFNLNWDLISQYQNLSYDFINKYMHKLTIINLLINKQISNGMKNYITNKFL